MSTCWSEVHRRLSPSNAVRLAKMVEEYEPFWFEEPVWAENVTALAAATAQINIPTVTGEELYTKFEFREVFEQRAADIINPDVANVGGIKELTEIAAMAEAYFVAVAPHNYNSTTVALASTLQAAATMPNFIITEYFVNFEPWGQEAATPAFESRTATSRSPPRRASASTSMRTCSRRIRRGTSPPGRSGTDRSALGVGPMINEQSPTPEPGPGNDRFGRS